MEGDEGVVILPEVQPAGYLGLGIRGEGLPVERAHEVLRSTASEGAPWVDVDEHHPFLLPASLKRKLEEVGALELVRACSVAFAESADVLPALKVFGAEEAHLLVCRDDHIPPTVRLVPEDLGVSEVRDPVRGCEDGVALVLGIA